MKLTKVGEKRLLKVRESILEKPQNLEMFAFRFCIAGRLLLLFSELPLVRAPDPVLLMRKAEALLFGNRCASRAVNPSLFYVSLWPKDLQSRYQACGELTVEAAKVAAEAIDRWIAGGGSFAEEPS